MFGPSAPPVSMGKVEQEPDTQSRMVLEICSMSTASVACIHRPARSHFVDWYRILQVGEDAGVDVIRKRYHKLALQLHPDKNKHSKAEVAFKLVSEAYTCLSDESKRRRFDRERRQNFCIQCNRIPGTLISRSNSSGRSSSSNSRSCGTLKDMRERFREETRVIESCLRNSRNPCCWKKEPPASDPPQRRRLRGESPVFNPSDYMFQGYPHVRSQIHYRRCDSLWWLQRERERRRDLPVFEERSDWSSCETKSACVRS